VDWVAEVADVAEVVQGVKVEVEVVAEVVAEVAEGLCDKQHSSTC